MTRIRARAALAATVMSFGASSGRAEQPAPSPREALPILEHPVALSVIGRVTTTLPDLGEATLTAPSELVPSARWSIPEGASLSGRCPDLTPFQLRGPLRDAISPCKPAHQNKPLGPIAPLRERVPPTVPRVLSPRATYVRELSWIAWQEVPDQTSYLVHVLNERFEPIWSQRVQEASRVRYTGPALPAGVPYTIRVSTSDGTSQTERADIAFRVLSDQARIALERAEARLRATQGLGASERRFLRALALRRFGLLAEAIDELREPRTPAFQFELAKSLISVGLFDLAAERLRGVTRDSAPESYLARASTRFLREIGTSLQ